MTRFRTDHGGGLLRSLAESLRRLHREQKLRRLTRVDRRRGPHIVIGGRSLVNFASNDYLGLANHPVVVHAAARGLRRFGVGAGASRLLAGHFASHESLEMSLARWKGTEAALLFPTGYMANLGLLTALIRPGDVIVSDAMNHASLIDACRLTKARVLIYPHGNVEEADQLLRKIRGRGRRFVLTETVFSMDGDEAPLQALSDMAQRRDAVLIADEAHALGVYGEGGRGTTAMLKAPSSSWIAMGTLSKSFGGMGGVVFGSRRLVQWLVNTARPFIYTTGMPPALAEASLAALSVIQREPERRADVWHRARHLHAALVMRGLRTHDSPSPITPVVIGRVCATMRIADRLRQVGFFAPGIRPPTVPAGTSRLRLTVTALHRQDHIDQLVGALDRALQ